MILSIDDWLFQVDKEATREHTTHNALDHCTCPYCKNYYDTVTAVYPGLERALGYFGVDMNGPSELMPFEPTYLLACYRVKGQILSYGTTTITADGIGISPEPAGEEGSFFLWVGELRLPWVQDVNEDEVVSPANLPEFLERMEQLWHLRHDQNILYS